MIIFYEDPNPHTHSETLKVYNQNVTTLLDGVYSMTYTCYDVDIYDPHLVDCNMNMHSVEITAEDGVDGIWRYIR